MAKNYMPEIAKMLGVEIGEEFKAYDTEVGVYGNEIFLFTDKGLVRKEHLNVDTCYVLKGLIQGTIEVVKLPWEPRKGEYFYYPDVKHKAVCRLPWDGQSFDFAMKSLGMVYRTKVEAETHLAEDYEKLTGKKLEG